ncbi:MAG: DNA primase [Limnochordales bacterium]|nr:DNA primase [Limnochordales bacterium]
MAGQYPPEWLEELRRANDIVQVISEHVTLKRSGRGFVGLCPFHQERTPSFHVHPERQFFHCFGCGTGGDVIRFVMLIRGLSFPEAVAWLAERAGIPLPAAGAAQIREERERRELLEVHRWAAEFFRQTLWSEIGRVCREYLALRGIKEETATRFLLGYAPPSPDAIQLAARRAGVSPALLIRAGLVITSRQGQAVDRFRGRLIFPICDAQGQVIAFGGRVLDAPGAEVGGVATSAPAPKYLNSPETALYRKGRQLYGLHLARESIRRLGSAVVVEGYMDCLSLVQAGVENVVASLGTALTPAQVQLLRRYAPTVTIAYDADTAGELATGRGLDLLEQAGLQVRVAVWPEGKDPDDVARQDPAEARERLGKALPIWEYRFSRLIGPAASADPEARRQAVRRVAEALARVPGAAEREVLVQQAAGLLAIPPTSLAQQVEETRRRQGMPGLPGARRSKSGSWQHTNEGGRLQPRSEQLPPTVQRPAEVEASLLAWICRHREEGRALISQLNAAWFRVPAYRRFVEALQEWGDLEPLLTGKAGEELAALAAAFVSGACGDTGGLLSVSVGHAAEDGTARGGGGGAGVRGGKPATWETGQELVWRVQAQAEIAIIGNFEQELRDWERMLPTRLSGLNRLILRYKQMVANLAPGKAAERGA